MVYPHVLHQLVVVGQLPLTHRAHCGIPLHCRQLVQYLCYLTGLGLLWQVLASQEG